MDCPYKNFVETIHTDCRDNPYICGDNPYRCVYIQFRYKILFYDLFRQHRLYNEPKVHQSYSFVHYEAIFIINLSNLTGKFFIPEALQSTMHQG